MTDGPDNLILLYLRRIDEKVDRIAEDVRDLKMRVTSLEGQGGRIWAEMGAMREDGAGMAARLDRIEARIERIERRMGSAGAA